MSTEKQRQVESDDSHELVNLDERPEHTHGAFFWIKNKLAMRKKRLEAVKAAQEALVRGDLEEDGAMKKVTAEEANEQLTTVEQAEAAEKVRGVGMGELDPGTLYLAYLTNRPVIISTYFPHLNDHNMVTGNHIGRTNDELIGLEAGQFLAEEFRNAKTLLLYDDYDSMPDSMDELGRPKSAGKHLEYPKEVTQTFRERNIGQLCEYGIAEMENAEEELQIVAATELAKKAELLVERLVSDPSLRDKGELSRDGDKIVYTVKNPDIPAHREIVLRNEYGRWKPEALDIALYMDGVEEESCHIVVRPDSYKNEQGRVWEVLNVLGFKPENMHNIYFEEGLDPSGVTEVIAKRLTAGWEEIKDDNQGSDFDPVDYIKMWYAERIIEEDSFLITNAFKLLEKMGLKLDAVSSAADIGTGPCLYPSMLMAPFVKEGGSIKLIEFGPSNRRYLKEMLSGVIKEYGAISNVWEKFQTFMTRNCGEAWNDSIKQVRDKGAVEFGSIYNLEKEAFDLVTSFSVTESITENMEEWEKAVGCLLDTVKPGGYLVIGHMLDEDKGYYVIDENGEKTFFPSLVLTEEDIMRVYSEKADIEMAKVEPKQKGRTGYEGMILVVGRKKPY